MSYLDKASLKVVGVPLDDPGVQVQGAGPVSLQGRLDRLIRERTRPDTGFDHGLHGSLPPTQTHRMRRGHLGMSEF